MVPHSHEVQDMLIRVDEQIGALLTSLDQLVGRDRYVVALSSDHGVALVPEQDGGVVAGSGRMSSTAIRTMINTAIESVIGPGTHVMARTGPNVYLAPGVLSRILGTAGARESITRAIVSFEGLARAYWAPELSSGSATDDGFLRAARLSYVEGRSGDLMVIPDPWMAQATGTMARLTTTTSASHCSLPAPASSLDVISSGLHPDIAPTFAHLAGITVSHMDGQVGTEAIR